MLTKSDLSEITKVVRKEIGNEVRNLGSTIRSEIKLVRMRLESAMRDIEDRLKNVEINQFEDHRLLLSLQKGVAKLQKDLSKTSDFLDRDNLATLKRVEKIESYLKSTNPKFTTA